MRRVTLSDVAAASGVSRATVSLVIRDSPQISDATKARVREAVQRLGYVYDRRAAVMRSGRSMTVGLVVTDVRNPWFAELTMALEVALHEHGFALLQGYSRDSRERESRLLEAMAEHRVDGLFLVPSTDTTSRDLQRRLVAGGMSHVLIARRVRGYDADYAGVDNVRAGEMLGEHLAAAGSECVAFVGGPGGSTARSERQRGLSKGLKQHGSTLDRAKSIATTADRSGGIEAVSALLERGSLPDAIACYSDVVAFGVLSGLRAAGVEPGRDVALASFDDITEAALQHPPLTSVATFPQRVGIEAARLLVGRIEEPDLAPRRVVLSPHLSVRASSTSRGHPALVDGA